MRNRNEAESASKKPFYKRWWFIIIVIIIVIFVIAAAGGDTPEDDTAISSSSQPSEEAKNEPVTSKYMTNGSWALYDSNYIFAIEVGDFNGDIFKNGDYIFELSAGSDTSKNTPAIFDIYVSDTLYANEAELTQSMNEPTLSIGGMGSSDDKHKYALKKGSYVYIVPFKEMQNEPSGYLNFTIAE